eukprot:GHVU01079542.1.p1 GENE.GHVU01079542.1~~GHVU01079542.1.p1  ORF type:complete len:114 (-),score=2.48 GHVU01079542.1:251-592(-)
MRTNNPYVSDDPGLRDRECSSGQRVERGMGANNFYVSDDPGLRDPLSRPPAPSVAGSRRMDDPGTRFAYGGTLQPTCKLASRTWPMFDDSKHRWDEFKARTVSMVRRAGHSDR